MVPAETDLALPTLANAVVVPAAIGPVLEVN
jgi:hypothetical protein